MPEPNILPDLHEQLQQARSGRYRVDRDSRTRTSTLCSRWISRWSRRLAVATALAVPALLPAQPRALRWRRVGIDARLDSAGMLHVAETQEMVFTGAWNGGERRFNVRPGQTFTFERMERLDSAGGVVIPMTEGNARRVDGYELADRSEERRVGKECA